ncbi:RING-H2 finger protein ATL8-like [Ipomoea triloba]|uniref:RING-H2 finger protein ATL8-like n=1 Tax=Ipomoea triloba TaxID=35885 RepID=UPI00125DB69F|nr:RING-H2 finger protein ATL8-like [Ipomoea triloba]
MYLLSSKLCGIHIHLIPYVSALIKEIETPLPNSSPMNQSDHQRFLGGVNSSISSSSPPPLLGSFGSGFLVCLASLVCALICIVGLFAVSRCACFRRVFGTATLPLPPAQANKGLKKKILRSLPKLSFAAAEHAPKLSECAICLAEFVGGDEIRILPQCGHGFHVACIDTWLRSHSSCPSCRQILVAGRCRKCDELPSAAAAASSSSSAVADTRIFAYQSNYHVNAIFP